MTNRLLGGKALVVDWRVPTPDCDGPSLRMFNLLRMLESLGYDVTFVADYPASWPPYADRLVRDTRNLRDAGIEVFPGAPAEALRRWGERYDVVMLSGGVQIAEKHLGGAREHAPQALVVFDTLDLHFVRHFREAKITGNARQLRRALDLKRRELAVARQADRTLVVSPVEKELLERECPGIRVHVVSNVHGVRGSVVPFAARKDVLFVGLLESPANVDAVLHYLDNIHPLVRKTLPGVRIHVIGNGAPLSIHERAADDVVVAGHIPDLASYFDRCRLSIAPIRFGAGVKGKVLTSMGHGVPTVASEAGAEGMGLLDRHDVLVADEPEPFCAAITELYRDEDLWNRLSANGLSTVARHFSFESVRSRLVEALDVPRVTYGPLVSVVIPVYNGERYLDAALQSIFEQDYRPLEVIVVDDGSVDGSARIAHSYEGVRYLYQSNRGPAVARNVGVAAARGEFVAFQDADDLWTPNKLSVQIGYLLEHPEVGYVLARGRNFLEPEADPASWVREDLLAQDYGYFLPTLVVRKAVFDEVGGFDSCYDVGEDTDWFLRANGANIRRFVVPEILLYRRIHSSNLSTRWQVGIRETLLKIAKRSIHRRRQATES